MLSGYRCTMTRHRTAVLLLCVALTGCSGTPGDDARDASPAASSTRAPSPRAGGSPTPAASPASAADAPASTGPAPSAGVGGAWPTVTREEAPPTLGAVVTTRVAAQSGGGTLAAGLLLPRVGGTAAAPAVLTPCGRRTTLRGSDLRVVPPSDGRPLPKRPGDVVVLLDPGHGGASRGTQSPDRTPEKLRVLEISREVERSLKGRVGRVLLTRDRDIDLSLAFRAALADALRVDVAVSVHLNAAPDIKGDPTPGLETYGSLAEPEGRRLAGVLYEHQRRYLDTLGGPWARDRDAGAKYRIGRDGRDYYALLRRAHRPFAISETMFLSEPREAALVARPDVRAQLGRAIADGIVAFTTTRAPGSGWVTPYKRGADPAGYPSACVDPAR